MSRAADLIIGALLLAAVAAVGWFALGRYGAAQYEAGRDAAIAERKRADDDAVLARTRDNALEAARQAADNLTITEKKHEELAPVRERIVTQRVYVGTALCGDRPAAPAEAEGAGSGAGADPARWLVRPDVDRDIVALKLKVEEAFATGRACQDTLRKNGMAP